MNEPKKSGIIANIFGRIRAWLNARKMRKICLAAFFVAAFFAVFFRIDKTNTCATIAIVFAIICVGASALDTYKNKKEFKNEIKTMRQKHFIRLAATEGEAAALKSKDCFTPADINYIKRKKWGYTGTFLVKVIIIILFIVLLVKMYS